MCLSSCFTETAPSAPMQSVVMYMCGATANTGVNSLLRRTECLMVRWKAEAHAKSGRRAAAPRRRLWCDWWDNFGLNSPDLGLGGCAPTPSGRFRFLSLSACRVERRGARDANTTVDRHAATSPSIKKCGAPCHQSRAMEHLGSPMIPFHFIVHYRNVSASFVRPHKRRHSAHATPSNTP